MTWEIVNIRQSTTPEEIRWDYTLVLKATTGGTIHFDKYATIAEGLHVQSSPREGSFSRKLESRSELHLDTYYGIRFAAGEGPQFGHDLPGGREGVTLLHVLHGKDENGQPVTVRIRFPLSPSIGRSVRRAGPILSVRAEGAFDGYRSDPKYTHMKAFAVDMSTAAWGVAWGYSQSTEAVKTALRECGRRGRNCELYAIGNTIVLGMAREEIDATVERYQLEDPRIALRIRGWLLRMSRDNLTGNNVATISPVPTYAAISVEAMTSPESVQREFDALARAGVIELRGATLIIRDVERLTQLVRQNP